MLGLTVHVGTAGVLALLSKLSYLWGGAHPVTVVSL